MSYSCKFIPYKGLQAEVAVSTLLNETDFSVARRCDLSKKEILKKCGDSYLIPQDANVWEEIYEQIPFMSMTYVDDDESIESASYRLLKPACDKWNGENVDLEEYKNSIERKNPCFQLVFSAKNLHNVSIPYSRKFDSQKDALKHGISESFSKEKKYPVTGKIVLKHSPTQLNYRHFELNLLDLDGKAIKDVSSRQKALANPCGKINGRDNFALYVLDQMMKCFTIDCLFEGTASLPESIFFDNRILPEDRENNKMEMQKGFKNAKLEVVK